MFQGRHILRDDFTACPSCDFPAIFSEFIRFVAELFESVLSTQALGFMVKPIEDKTNGKMLIWGKRENFILLCVCVLRLFSFSREDDACKMMEISVLCA